LIHGGTSNTLTTMERDPVADARDLVRARFPQARWSIVTGSVVTTQRTPGSDLDIVVLLTDGDPDVPYRCSTYFRDWPAELFVHDDRSLKHYLAKDLSERRPVMHRMIAQGIPLDHLPDPDLHDLQARCAAVLADGPPPLPAATLDLARYRLTGLLDDLRHSHDTGEELVVTVAIWLATAELACDARQHWRGTGKWILRELTDADPAFAERWVAAHSDPQKVRLLAEQVLEEVGGPRFAEFHLAGDRPVATSA
jgi:hypothetical protein